MNLRHQRTCFSYSSCSCLEIFFFWAFLFSSWSVFQVLPHGPHVLLLEELMKLLGLKVPVVSLWVVFLSDCCHFRRLCPDSIRERWSRRDRGILKLCCDSSNNNDELQLGAFQKYGGFLKQKSCLLSFIWLCADANRRIKCCWFRFPVFCCEGEEEGQRLFR